VFDTREKAALAYKIVREKLITDNVSTENIVKVEETFNLARQAALEAALGGATM
jgi:hypothetical protein